MISKELYPIFKRDNAMKLKEMGFPIEDASTNKKHLNHVIYYFKKTNEFLQAFTKINQANE